MSYLGHPVTINKKNDASVHVSKLLHLGLPAGSVVMATGSTGCSPALRGCKSGTHARARADTYQRGSARATAERLVEGRAGELQFLQVAVGNSDVSGQRQAFVEVLKTQNPAPDVHVFSTHTAKYIFTIRLNVTFHLPLPIGCNYDTRREQSAIRKTKSSPPTLSQRQEGQK